MASIFQWEEQKRSSQFLNHAFQQALARWNRKRLAPALPSEDWQAELDDDFRMQRLEGAFLDELRAGVAERAAAAPTEVDAFI